jgi:hypothetical protein
VVCINKEHQLSTDDIDETHPQDDPPVVAERTHRERRERERQSDGPMLYVPPSAEEEGGTGYDLPGAAHAEGGTESAKRPGKPPSETPPMRTVFAVAIDVEGMAHLFLDPNDLNQITEVDRPAIPNDVFLACTQLLRDVNNSALAQQVVMTMGAMAQQQMQAMQSQQLATAAAKQEIARIDQAAAAAAKRR